MALAPRARTVRFFAPSFKHYESTEFPTTGHRCDFAAISVTGQSCRLACDHCRGILLGSMEEARSPRALLDLARRLRAEGCSGILLSGGADLDGRVPLLPFVDAMAEIREALGMIVLAHAGIVTRGLAEGLARARIECAMVDVIGSTETLVAACNLDVGVAGIEGSLRLLAESGIRTVPHVVAGLDHGRIVGERTAIDMAARHAPSALVLVVLTPLPGTPMCDATPPAPIEVASLIGYARSVLAPDTPILLGCARPGGLYRREIDRLALEAGIDGIAFPAEGTVSRARAMGLEISFHTTCCAVATPASIGCAGRR